MLKLHNLARFKETKMLARSIQMHVSFISKSKASSFVFYKQTSIYFIELMVNYLFPFANMKINTYESARLRFLSVYVFALCNAFKFAFHCLIMCLLY